MKPFIVLILATAIALLIIIFSKGVYNIALSARIGMSVMLLFTAMGHFMFTEGMTMMIPEYIPFRKELVYFTAIVEIAGAIGLHLPQFRTLTGWLLIIFLILVLPANIRASINQIDFQKGTYDGNGIKYLWFRIPLQILFIGWIYLSSIRFN